MKAAPITLLEYFATDMALSANPDFSPERALEIKEGDFQVQVQSRRVPMEAEDRRWQVTLNIMHQAAKGTNFPYAFRVVLVGFFKAEAWVKAGDEERMVGIQAPSVLFGMAREIVRALTGRGPHRPVILPTVSFYEQKSGVTAIGQSAGTGTELSIKRKRTPKAGKKS